MARKLLDLKIQTREKNMKLLTLVFGALQVTFSSFVSAADGLVAVKSPHSAVATLDKLESLVEQRGLTVFARIDHAAGAAKIGQTLRPTALLIFGNPQGGTPLMQCAQTAGIDLPLKMLVWEDAQGKVWLGYNDPAYLAPCPVVGKLQAALAGLAAAVAVP